MDTETHEDVPLNRQTSETAKKSDSKISIINGYNTHNYAPLLGALRSSWCNYSSRTVLKFSNDLPGNVSTTLKPQCKCCMPANLWNYCEKSTTKSIKKKYTTKFSIMFQKEIPLHWFITVNKYTVKG